MIGSKIKQRMKEVGISSQAELARRSGLSESTVSAIIGGTRGKRMAAETAYRLSKALHTNQIFLLPSSTNVERREMMDDREAANAEDMGGGF